MYLCSFKKMDVILTRKHNILTDFQMITNVKLSEKSLSPRVICDIFSTFTCLFLKWVKFFFRNPNLLATREHSLV